MLETSEEMSGAMKLIQPKSKLDAKMATLKGFSSWQVKAIGALEVLAALGLARPLIFDTGLILVPLAATDLVLLMIGAIITHARLKEFPMIAITAVLGALSLWVAIWGYSDLITAPINLLVGRSETGCRPLGTPCTTCC